MIHASLGRKFKVVNLLGAILLLVVGVAGIAQPLYSNVIHIKFLLAGLAGIAGGIYVLVANTWVVSCKRCSTFLEDYELHFGSDGDGQALQTALQARSPEHLLSIFDHAPVPPIAQPGQFRYSLAFELCLTCRQTARVSLAKVTFDANGNASSRKELVSWTELSSPLVATLLDRVVSRNERATAIGFGTGYTAQS